MSSRAAKILALLKDRNEISEVVNYNEEQPQINANVVVEAVNSDCMLLLDENGTFSSIN